MKITIWSTSVVLSLILVSAPLFAHHNFQAEFDSNLPIEVSGTVVRFSMTNPHARLYIQEIDENDETINWDFELAAASSLMRRGWRRDSVKPGDTVVVSAHRAINHPHVGNARSVTLISEDGENRVFGQTRD